MRNNELKSLAVANTHHIVDRRDPRLVQLKQFVDILIMTYGRNKPLKYAPCCNSFLIFQGSKGYIAGHVSLASIYNMTDKEDKLDIEKLIEVLIKEGHANANLLCMPGFNLYHTTYYIIKYLSERPVDKTVGSQEEEKARPNLN